MHTIIQILFLFCLKCDRWMLPNCCSAHAGGTWYKSVFPGCDGELLKMENDSMNKAVTECIKADIHVV